MKPFYILEDPTSVRDTASCRACHQPIYWVTGASTHRRMPFDALVQVAPEGLIGTDVFVVDLEKNHWATCPNAAEFRRGRKGQ